MVHIMGLDIIALSPIDFCFFIGRGWKAARVVAWLGKRVIGYIEARITKKEIADEC